jgi:hypothetical protein
MVDKLNDPESRFHALLVTNVFDLVDLLPLLNVNQDEDLNRFAAEIKDRLCNFSAHDLKKNEILRVATATDAAQVLSQMDAVLRGREQDSAELNEKSTPQNAPSVEDISDRAPSRSSFLRFTPLPAGWTGFELDSDHGHGWRLPVLQPGLCRDAERGRTCRRSAMKSCTRRFSTTRVAETVIESAGIWHATMPSTLYSWMLR